MWREKYSQKPGFSWLASDLVSKVAQTFATRILLIGIGLTTSAIVARILGPEGRGVYVVASTIGAIGVQFGNLGLHSSNTYYIAKDRNLLPALLGNTLAVSFGFGGFGAALAWVVFSLWPSLAPVHGTILGLALVGIPLGLAYLLVQNILIGINEVSAYNKIELASKILTVSLISLAILFQAVTVETVFSTGLIALLISFTWALWRLQPYLSKFPLPSLALFKDNIGYGFKVYLACFFSFMVLKSDLLMVQYLLGAEQTGYYSVAVNMADMVYMLPSIIGTMLFPKLSAMPSKEEKWQLSKKVSLVVGVMMTLVAIFAAIIAEPIVRSLFGYAFLPAVPAFLWLMPGIVILSINIIYMNYFGSTGMPLITVYSSSASALFNILLNIKLIPCLGIIGASISSVAAYGMMLCFSLVFIRSDLRQQAVNFGGRNQ